jgi:hypothetical protein
MKKKAAKRPRLSAESKELRKEYWSRPATLAFARECVRKEGPSGDDWDIYWAEMHAYILANQIEATIDDYFERFVAFLKESEEPSQAAFERLTPATAKRVH